MSSTPPPPPPPRSSKPLHNFEMPSNLKWSTKGQSTSNPTRGRRVSESPSLSRQQPQSPATAASGQPELSIDWLHDNLSKPPTSAGSSSGGSSTAKPDLPTTFTFGASAVECRNTSSSKPSTGSALGRSSPLRIKLVKSSGSSASGPSALRPCGAPESGSSSEGAYSSTALNVTDSESTCIELLQSGFAIDQFDKQKPIEKKQGTRIGSEGISESFGKKLSVYEMQNEEDKEEKLGNLFNQTQGAEDQDTEEIQAHKRENNNKPLKTYVRSFKKRQNNQGSRKMKVQVPKREVEEQRPVAPQDDMDDLDAKIWNFRPRKANQKPLLLNLEKNVGSSSKDQGDSAGLENKEKQFNAAEEGKAEKDDKKKKGKEPEKGKKKKKKNEKKEPKQEQEPEIKLPKFAVQLTPEEIADDLFAMTGTRPTRKPTRRGKNIQRQVDQVTPGLWLESIDAERYKVYENVGKGTK